MNVGPLSFRDASVEIEPFDRTGAFITMEGALDVCSDDVIRDAVASAIRAGYVELVIDFGPTTFLDSGAFRALLEAVASIRDRDDAAVVLVGGHGCVERLLAILDADQLSRRYPDRATARRALRLPAARTVWR
jgi:anti-anti-sigma factor